MGTVYAIANQKGGVGKTTSAVNLASCTAGEGEQTLIVDLDPQCNATVALGGDRDLHPSSYDCLTGDTEVAAAVAELLLTFALSYVMLNVATSKDQPGNGFFGLAIGFTVTAGAFAVGGISGGVFNPAVALGGATAGIFAWSTIWVYLVVQLGAGIAAGLTFLVLNPGDRSLRTYTGGPN